MRLQPMIHNATRSLTDKIPRDVATPRLTRLAHHFSCMILDSDDFLSTLDHGHRAKSAATDEPTAGSLV